MFLDALLLVSDAQALTATGFSTNTIDLGNPTIKNRIGSGEAIGFEVTLDVAADFTTGDETYLVEVVSSANANLSSPTVVNSRSLSTAAMRALGAKLFIGVPKGTPLDRYLGLRYTLGGTTPTITVTAGLTLADMAEDRQDYAKGYSL